MRKIQKPAGSVYTSEGEETSMKTIRNWTGLAALAACTLTPVTHAKEKTLYDRLGGKKAITAVVDEFVGRVAADTRINNAGDGRGNHSPRASRIISVASASRCSTSGW